jgi:MYXO-CTERM domain-containing protein
VVEDNAEPILTQLANYNSSVLPTLGSGSAGSANGANSTSGGCSIAPTNTSWGVLLGALVVGSARLRRRRSR